MGSLEAGGDTLVLVSTIVNVKDIVRAYNDALPNDRDVNRLLQSPPPTARQTRRRVVRALASVWPHSAPAI